MLEVQRSAVGVNEIDLVFGIDHAGKNIFRAVLNTGEASFTLIKIIQVLKPDRLFSNLLQPSANR